MKRYNELTQEELVSLTDEQLNTLIELEIAYAGILPEAKPEPLPPFDPGIEPTIEAYEVHGLIFINAKDALTVSGLKIMHPDYDYKTGSKYKYLTERAYGTDCSKVFFYDKNEVEAIRLKLIERREKEEEYDKQKNAYDKYIKSISQYRNEVLGAYRAACDYKYRLEQAKAQLMRYQTLADGNEVLAKRFFMDAYKGKPDIINDLFPGELPNAPLPEGEES